MSESSCVGTLLTEETQEGRFHRGLCELVTARLGFLSSLRSAVTEPEAEAHRFRSYRLVMLSFKKERLLNFPSLSGAAEGL